LRTNDDNEGSLYFDLSELRDEKIEIEYDADTGTYAVTTPWNKSFVHGIKTEVSAFNRRWDPQRKVWVVSEAGVGGLADVLNGAFDVEVTVAPSASTAAVVAREDIDVHYMGLVKTRTNGDETAYGHDGQDWAYVFPRSVLESFFSGGKTVLSRPTQAATHFAVLGVARSAGEDEIRRAYRRTICQWHPDVCEEPDATEQFMAVQKAREILLDKSLRGRYEAGLAFQESVDGGESHQYNATYSAPVRCGRVAVDIERGVKLGFIHKIHEWKELRDKYGKVLVSSWPAGADMYQERWVTQ